MMMDALPDAPRPRCRCSLTPWLPASPAPDWSELEDHPDIVALAEFVADFYQPIEP